MTRVVVLLLLLGMADPAGFRCAARAIGRESTSQVSDPPSSPAERKDDFDEFMAMRKFWFTVKPSDAAIVPSADFPSVFSVIMDWPIDHQSLGLVRVMVGAVSDGTSSLYISPGPRVLGGYSAKDHAQEAIRAAMKILPNAQRTERYPLPPAGIVRFHLRTFAGLFVLEEKLTVLINRQGKTTDLFEALNRVMAVHLDSIDAERRPKVGVRRSQRAPAPRKRVGVTTHNDRPEQETLATTSPP